MTDDLNTPAADQTPAPAPRSPVRNPRRKWLIGAGLVAALGIGGAVAAQSFDRPGFFHHGMMGRGGWGGGSMNMDATDLANMADRGIRHAAVEIDATPDQQEKLRAIVRDLVKDVAPMREAREQAAERIRALLTQETVNKDEIEKFRAEQVGKMDDVSKRVTKAVDDAADVLTPAQRRKLVDRMPRPGAGPFWRRG